MAANTQVSLLRNQLKGAFEMLEGVMADLTAEQIHWIPPGVANPISASYAHVVTGTDGIINGILKGDAPLMATSWAGKVGLSEPPPAPDSSNPGLPNWGEWGRRVKIDLGALREYAQAVYASTDDYLAALTDADLNRPIDLSGIGLDESTVGQTLMGGVLSNVQWHTGEISCLKGLQGLKGYPV